MNDAHDLNHSQSNLRAERTDGVWTVVDPAGGRWWPFDETARLLDEHALPDILALRLCILHPSAGEWRN